MVNNQVEHPDHYNKGNIECFDVIKAYYGDDVFEHFCLGNVLKYIMRCKSKENYLQDLKKARVYLDKLIAKVEKEQK